MAQVDAYMLAHPQTTLGAIHFNVTDSQVQAVAALACQQVLPYHSTELTGALLVAAAASVLQLKMVLEPARIWLHRQLDEVQNHVAVLDAVIRLSVGVLLC